MSDCKKYAIFVWINDDPVTGRVLKLSNITHPRRDYDEYFEGQEVDAKCPGFGINKAVIGKISDETGKKKLEDILNGNEFKEIVTTLLHLPSKITPDEQEKSSSALEDRTGENVSQQAMVVEEKKNEEENSVEKKENKKTKVHRPKAVRRKLVTGMGHEVAEQTKSKELQLIAEDLALTDLSNSQASQHLQEDSTPELVFSSLDIVNKTGNTPHKRKHSDMEMLIAENARLAKENKELAGRLSTAEWSLQYLWNEVSGMKMEIGRLTTSSQASTSAFQSPKPHKMPTASAGEVTPDVSQSLCIPEVNNPRQESPCTELYTGSGMQNEVHNGYVKSQIMEELARSANFRKGTARGFKMLFRPEEYEGRSLSGGKSNTGVQRLAIEDQKKWDFLEDCIVEKWAVPRESIRAVIRDMLKPSRTKSKAVS